MSNPNAGKRQPLANCTAWEERELEGNAKVRVLRVGRNLLDPSPTNVVSKLQGDLLQTQADLIGPALDQHLHCSIRQVPHKTGQALAAGDLPSRISEAYTLHMAYKEDTPGSLCWSHRVVAAIWILFVPDVHPSDAPYGKGL